MGLNWTLIGFPLVVLLLSIMFQVGGAPTASAAPPVVIGVQNAGGAPPTYISISCGGGSTSTSTCSGYLTTWPTTGAYVVDCASTEQPPFPGWNFNDCIVYASQGNNDVCGAFGVVPDSPFYCNAGTWQTGVYIDQGQTGYIVNGSTVFSCGSGYVLCQVATGGVSNAIFNFGGLGAAGFIAMIGVAIAVVAVLGITIVGSGENTEAIHILFIGGFGLGLWAMLSIAEGFLTPNPNSKEFFHALDGMMPGVGTAIYVVLTLIYAVGIVGTISRGTV